MNHYYKRTLCTIHSFSFLLLLLLSTISCKKESYLEPSTLDENYFVNIDNPSDAVDHAIFNFYKETGVASFYNDTIAKRIVSKEGEHPERFSYITLKTTYTPSGVKRLSVFKLTSTDKIPSILKVLKDRMIPKLASTEIIPSILFIDSFSTETKFTNIRLSDGQASFAGFNTLAVRAMDVESMTEEDKDLYANSVLTGIICNKLLNQESAVLSKEFFSISKKMTMFEENVYLGLQVFLLYGIPVPEPETYGLTHIPFADLVIMPSESLPTEESDLRGFIMNVLRFNETEIATKYSAFPEMIQKDNIVRKLMIKYGIKTAI